VQVHHVRCRGRSSRVICTDDRGDCPGGRLSVFFTSDRVAVRAVCRVGFAFPHPGAVVKVTLA